MIMTVIVMIVGIALPFSPLASYLQLQALPLSYFPWLVAILAGYMTLTQLVKGFIAVVTAGNKESTGHGDPDSDCRQSEFCLLPDAA